MILHDIDELPADRPFVATIGVFDGLHLGHLHVLRMLTDAAAAEGASPVAITFDPHPEAVVLGRAPELLCSVEERTRRLLAAGVAVVVVQRFDETFRQQSAETFLDRLRLGRQLRGLVMSPESAFGHDREGTIDLVRRVAANEGWTLVEIPVLEVDGERVSSNRIRALLAEGRRADAERLLGRALPAAPRSDGGVDRVLRDPVLHFAGYTGSEPSNSDGGGPGAAHAGDEGTGHHGVRHGRR